jgi:epsin
VTGLEEYGPPSEPTSQRPERPERRRRFSDEEDAEYRLAIEASKAQEEEDRRNREGRGAAEAEDDDLAKAIRLSKEEEERRRKELEETNASSLFDDDLIQTTPQPQFTGFNQGYTQGNQVDFFANPIDQNQMQPQPTGFMPNAYTAFQPQATGFPGGYPNGFGQPNMGMDLYGQQQMQQFQPQQTSFNPYSQMQAAPQPQPEPVLQPGSNNPWASNNNPMQSHINPTPTGSNNPFAFSLGRPQAAKPPSMPSLGSLPEQKTLTTFQSQPPVATFSQPQQPQPKPTPSFTAPQKELSEHEAKLNALLASGEGMDTFGNTGQLRIPAQHTAPGTFVNSAGSGINRLTEAAGASNPFLRTQYTGMPGITYGGGGQSQGSAGVNGASNPFSGNRPQQNSQSQDLIQF